MPGRLTNVFNSTSLFSSLAGVSSTGSTGSTGFARNVIVSSGTSTKNDGGLSTDKKFNFELVASQCLHILKISISSRRLATEEVQL